MKGSIPFVLLVLVIANVLVVIHLQTDPLLLTGSFGPSTIGLAFVPFADEGQSVPAVTEERVEITAGLEAGQTIVGQ